MGAPPAPKLMLPPAPNGTPPAPDSPPPLVAPRPAAPADETAVPAAPPAPVFFVSELPHAVVVAAVAMNATKKPFAAWNKG